MILFAPLLSLFISLRLPSARTLNNQGGTCSKDKPCVSGQCCSKFGFCGYGEPYCGKGCQSNCEGITPITPASRFPLTVTTGPMTQCGQNAPPGRQDCNTGCCSKHGFCGFGRSFCGEGCQRNCQTECGFLAPIDKRNCEQGCCSRDGFCGFGPEFCGNDCQGSCESVAECGAFAVAGNVECPLRVCCSRFGYCGTTEEFCGSGCQSNCGMAKLPVASSRYQLSVSIGYYALWATDATARYCNWFEPDQINAQVYTHIIIAFARITEDGRLALSREIDSELYRATVALKGDNPDLKVMAAVGGWAFNDPPTEHIFSETVATEMRRKRFVDSVLEFLTTHQLDGLDLDWEYPVAKDRGGSKEDSENYLDLIKNLRSAFSADYLLTIAAPASYWYLRHFPIAEMAPYLDWINVMTYDFHGVWDAKIPTLGPIIRPHTSMVDIEQAIKLYVKANVPVEKLVLGLALYGRSYTCESKDCTHEGCRFAKGGAPGQCTREPGVLAYFEIVKLVKQKKLVPVLDLKSGTKICRWDDDQWISFDDHDTLVVKADFAKRHGLKGIMVWSIDQDISDSNNHAHLSSTFQRMLQL